MSGCAGLLVVLTVLNTCEAVALAYIATRAARIPSQIPRTGDAEGGPRY